MRYVIVGFIALFLAIPLIEYGTISPCGIVRYKIREAALHGPNGGAALLGALLPDAAIDAVVEAQYGQLTPMRCVGLLFSGGQAPASPAPAPRPNVTPRVDRTFRGNLLVADTCRMGECDKVYLTAASPNPQGTITATARIENYVVPVSGSPALPPPPAPHNEAYTLSCAAQGGYIETTLQSGKTYRLEQPNPHAAHYSLEMDSLWAAVCRRSQ